MKTQRFPKRLGSRSVAVCAPGAARAIVVTYACGVRHSARHAPARGSRPSCVPAGRSSRLGPIDPPNGVPRPRVQARGGRDARRIPTAVRVRGRKAHSAPVLTRRRFCYQQRDSPSMEIEGDFLDLPQRREPCHTGDYGNLSYSKYVTLPLTYIQPT